MNPNLTTRRNFLAGSLSTGAALPLAHLSWVLKLPPVRAEDLKPLTGLQNSGQRVSELVQLIESVERKNLIEAVASRIVSGTSYRDLLAALMLAAVRNVQPHPSVGFKFHAVLVVHSAHLATVSGPDSERWLPFFWALDYFKGRQEEEQRVSGWTMKPLSESRIPSPSKAKEQFIAAMDRWDVEAAECAAAGLARGLGGNEVFELFFRYAARDYRSIGHKVIYVANSWRTLQLIGWQHAEPILRSLTAALLNHHGEPNPSESDLDVDRPWRENQPRAASLRQNWLEGSFDPQAVGTLIETIRESSPTEASEAAAKLIEGGQSPQSVWDAVFLGAGELLMQQPASIIGLHAMTTANAMRQAFIHCADDGIRRRLTLQACSFLPMFRKSAEGRGKVRKRTLTQLIPDQADGTADPKTLQDILRNISRNRDQAAGLTLGWRANGGSAEAIIDATRRLVFLKGNDAHDYKFSSAVLEDYYQVSPDLRDRFLALSIYNLIGSESPDNAIVKRIRNALPG